MGFIYLKNKIISNLSLSNNVIGVYVALRCIYQRDKPKCYISINSLLYELFNSFDYKRQDYKNISDGLVYLQNNQIQDNEYVKFHYFEDAKGNKSKKEFVVDLSVLDIDKGKKDNEYYTVIFDDELRFIMNYGKTGKYGESQINNLALLRYFIFLISTINFSEGVYIDVAGNTYNNFVGYQSHKYLSDNVGISENTLIKFNTILEENNIVYFKRNNKNRITLSGDFRSLRNHYGRYKDKEYIDKFNDQYLLKVGMKEPLSKKQTKINQSLANKYHWITKGKEYDDIELIKKIYNYVHKCNEEIQNEIAAKYKQSSLTNSEKEYIKKLEDKIRDESYFEKYDFLGSNDLVDDTNIDTATNSKVIDTNDIKPFGGFYDKIKQPVGDTSFKPNKNPFHNEDEDDSFSNTANRNFDNEYEDDYDMELDFLFE